MLAVNHQQQRRFHLQTYSLEAILLSCFLTFILSGILGALFKDWLERAKVDVVVQSFGLAPSTKPIEIPQELRSHSEKCGWMPSLHRFESYSKLSGILKQLKRVNARLRLARTSVDDWSLDNRLWEENYASSATVDEMSECPFFRDQTVGSLLIGSARRGEIKDPTVKLADLEKLPEVTELAESEDGWHLYMRDKNALFPTGNTRVETTRRILKQFAESFARGSKGNIYYYMNEYKRLSAEDVNIISEIIQKLEQLLTPASLLQVKVSILNHGTKPATIRPFARMQFHNDEVAGFKPVMRVIETPRSSLESSSLELMLQSNAKTKSIVDDGTDGDDVLIEESFPNSDSNSYVLLAPKSHTILTLTSEQPLGESAERILSMYKAAVLRSSVVVLTIDKKQLSSPNTLFGQFISDDERALLNI